MKRDRSSQISCDFIDSVVAQLAAGEPVRRALPLGGRLCVDRQLPFLCTYRRPVDAPDEGTERLVASLASHLVGSLDERIRKSQAELILRVVETMQGQFGAFLLVDVWAEAQASCGAQPTARVFCSAGERAESLGDLLADTLAADKLMRHRWRTEVVTDKSTSTRRLSPTLTSTQARSHNCTRLGLSVPALYRDADSDDVLPAVLRRIRRVVEVGLHKTAFEFVRLRTTRKPKEFSSLGRRVLSRDTRTADQELAKVAASFDFLLVLTPTNVNQAWNDFRRARFERAPSFRYRPLSVDVSELKRRLFSVSLDRVEDPTMADLLREKQFELDRQLTVLAERGSRRVLYGSLQLYGDVDAALVKEAERIVEMIPPSAKEGDGKRVTAVEFAKRARREIESYRRFVSVEGVGVEVRDDVAAGLMVTKGRLLISAASTFPASRVDALIQHEIGTHVLTYLNGRSQQFQQMSTGLADYDGTQEGLAVVAEYLAGGLSRPRMRLLAGRVIACRSLIDGATFIDAFRLLLRYGFAQAPAYNIVVRVYRGGGLTKDAVYLQGLRDVVSYIQSDEPIDLLYAGKIALKHVEVVRELTSRGVLTAAPLAPRYLKEASTKQRCERLREQIPLYELISADAT